MRRLCALLAALALASCPPATPAPNVPPDADAAPAPPSPTGTSCADACTLLRQAGCAETQDDCPVVLQLWNDNGTKKNPRTGGAFRCTDLAGALTPADIRPNGFRCASRDGGG
jgi:hypothetical protein